MSSSGRARSGRAPSPCRAGAASPAPPGCLLGAVLAGGLALGPVPAHAHAAGSGFILLLPTHLYIAGGTAVVALSLLLVALVPPRAFAALAAAATPLARVGGPGVAAAARAARAVALALLAVLVATGWAGSRDPLANPLPLVLWSVWWVGFTVLHALAGDLWGLLMPWRALYRLVTARGPLRRWRAAPPLRYPRRAGYWPAVALLAGFAWFELVYPAPADPAVLATAVTAYALLTLTGMCLFGEAAWLQHAEPFGVFFRMVAWLAPVTRDRTEAGCPACARCRAAPDCLNCATCAAEGPWTLRASLPPLHLLRVRPLPPSGVAFVLLALASVSFDGLSRTFAWLGALGANPLEYPGRTALVPANTLGLLGLWGALGAAYMLALAAGPASSAPGRLVLSIVPLAFGYHLAHYLPVLLVDSQYALRAVSDPLARGWDLLGTATRPVVTSFLAHPATLYPIWTAQLSLIVGAHLAAVAVAHALVLQDAGPAGARRQWALAALMVAYTGFGLWLLASPAAG